MRTILLATLILTGCVQPAESQKSKMKFIVIEGYPHRIYCVDSVSYFESYRNDPLIMLDKDSKIIPCNVAKEK